MLFLLQIVNSLRSRLAFAFALVLLIGSSFSSVALARDIWQDGVLSNSRATFDFSSRGIYSDGNVQSSNAIGLDFHKVFTGSRGDIGTLTLQPFLRRIDTVRTPGDSEPKDSDQIVQWRISNFNLKALPSSALNFRVGHFELPFGAEQIIPTNGTLLQTNATANTGLKADWGFSVNGVVRNLEYELAWLRGGGNNIHSDASGYVVGRVGWRRDFGGWLGLSFIDGEMESQQGLVERSRLGFDAGWRFARGVHLLVDHSFGRENGESAWDLLFEMGYTSRTEASITYLQYRTGKDPGTDGVNKEPRVVVGLRFEPGARWTFSLEHATTGKRSAGASQVAAQLRMRI